MPIHNNQGRAVPADRLTQEQRERIDELAALDVPAHLIARRIRASYASVFERMKYNGVLPGPAAERLARHKRIQIHIAEYPNRSLFGTAR